jgi:hypothetical protein
MSTKSKTTTPVVGRMSDAQLVATLGRRLSGASGNHDSRPNRTRTRGTARKFAIADSRGKPSPAG